MCCIKLDSADPRRVDFDHQTDPECIISMSFKLHVSQTFYSGSMPWSSILQWGNSPGIPLVTLRFKIWSTAEGRTYPVQFLNHRIRQPCSPQRQKPKLLVWDFTTATLRMLQKPPWYSLLDGPTCKSLHGEHDSEFLTLSVQSHATCLQQKNPAERLFPLNSMKRMTWKSFQHLF